MAFTLTTQRASTSHASFRTGHLVSKALMLTLSLLALPSRVMRQRRLMGAMGRMTDRDLADIGLTRQDIHDSQIVSIRTELGGFLSARAAERRTARSNWRNGAASD